MTYTWVLRATQTILLELQTRIERRRLVSDSVHGVYIIQTYFEDIFHIGFGLREPDHSDEEAYQRYVDKRDRGSLDLIEQVLAKRSRISDNLWQNMAAINAHRVSFDDVTIVVAPEPRAVEGQWRSSARRKCYGLRKRIEA